MHPRDKNRAGTDEKALRAWFDRLEWPGGDEDFHFDTQRWNQEWSRRGHPERDTPHRWVRIAIGLLVITGSVSVITLDTGHHLALSPKTTPILPKSRASTPLFLAAQASPVIVQAMHALGSDPRVPLEAPQTLPYAQQKTTILSATAHVWGGTALPTYQVELWQTPQAWPINSPRISVSTAYRLAAYSGTNYARQGATGLQEGLQNESGYSIAPGPQTAVPLAPGIIAQESQSSASVDTVSATSLHWKHGRWQIVVNAPSAAIARQQSQQLVQAMTARPLPTPSTQGYLVLNVTPSVTSHGSPRLAPQVSITWSRETTVYHVTTYSDVFQRTNMAIEIAHSMRRYTP